MIWSNLEQGISKVATAIATEQPLTRPKLCVGNPESLLFLTRNSLIPAGKRKLEKWTLGYESPSRRQEYSGHHVVNQNLLALCRQFLLGTEAWISVPSRHQLIRHLLVNFPSLRLTVRSHLNIEICTSWILLITLVHCSCVIQSVASQLEYRTHLRNVTAGTQAASIEWKGQTERPRCVTTILNPTCTYLSRPSSPVSCAGHFFAL